MNNKPESLDVSGDLDQAELNRLLLDGLKPISPNSRQHEVLRQDLMTRVTESISKQTGLLTVRLKDGTWQTLKSGVRVKQLWKGLEGSSVLIELAAGTSLLPHRHNWLEEGIVLRGGLQMGKLELAPLDYHISPAGSRHAAISSRQGALAYLRGTSLGSNPDLLREVLGGLIPFSNDLSRTVYIDNESAWQKIAEGLLKRDLWTDGMRASCYYRLKAGTKLPEFTSELEHECMILEGEVFVGDTLLCSGDYQWTPPGNLHGEVYSDVGATLFVRGALNC